jgi:hypothetical protein
MVFQKYLAGALIIGFLHKIISRSIYNHIRQVLLTLCDLKLPGYKALQRQRKRVQAAANYPITQKNAITGATCFSLSAANIVAHVN